MIGSWARATRAMYVLGAVDDLIMIIKADRCVVTFCFVFSFIFFIIETLFSALYRYLCSNFTHILLRLRVLQVSRL